MVLTLFPQQAPLSWVTSLLALNIDQFQLTPWPTGRVAAASGEPLYAYLYPMYRHVLGLRLLGSTQLAACSPRWFCAFLHGMSIGGSSRICESKIQVEPEVVKRMRGDSSTRLRQLQAQGIPVRG